MKYERTRKGKPLLWVQSKPEAAAVKNSFSRLVLAVTDEGYELQGQGLPRFGKTRRLYKLATETALVAALDNSVTPLLEAVSFGAEPRSKEYVLQGEGDLTLLRHGANLLLREMDQGKKDPHYTAHIEARRMYGPQYLPALQDIAVTLK